MAIWTSFWYKIWVPEIQKKKEEQFISVVPQKKQTQMVANANKTTPIVPQKQMMSYIIKPSKPSQKYSWMEQSEEDYINKQVDGSWLAWIEKDMLKEEAVKTFMEVKQAKAFLNDRENTRDKLSTGELSSWDKDIDNKTYRTSQFADIIRKDALSSWVRSVTNVNDKDIIEKTLMQKPELAQVYIDFVDGKKNVFELLNWLKWGVEWKINAANQELIDKPLTTLENISAFGLWTAQWLSDVWYKVVWEKINKLWENLGNKLENTKFADWVRKLWTKIFWEAAMKEFQASETERKWLSNKNSAEENSNILRTVWGRKMEQSWFGKAGKTTGKFIWQTALEMAAWWVAWGVTKKIIWWTAKNLAMKKIKSAAIWAVAWMWTAEATALSKEGKLATGKQLKAWAILWWIGWAIFASHITPSEKNVWNYLLDWLSKTEKQARWASMWLSPNVFWKIKNVFSKSEKELIDATKWIINPKKTSVYNMNKLNNIIKSEWAKVEKIIAAHPYKANMNNIKWAFNKIDPPATLRKDATMNAVYEEIKDKYLKAINATDKSALAIFNVRKEFDALVEKEIPGLWTTAASNPMKLAIQDLRRVPNNIVNDMIQNDIVKNTLKKQSLMYDAIKLLTTRTEKVWTTVLWRNIQANKELYKAWGLVVWGALGSRLVWWIWQ